MDLFFKYLKNPHYIKNEKIYWHLFLKLLISFYVISIPIGLICGQLIKLMNFYDLEFHYSTFKILVAGIILGPIIEELFFRFLLKPKYNNLIIFFCFSIGMIILSLIKSNKQYLIFFFATGFVSFFFIRNKKYLRIAQKYFIKHFCYIFYLSCILFGFYHITNYSPITYKLVLIMPIIVLPQIISSTFIGFIRMKFGIIYSILFHSVTNIFPIFVLIMS